METVIRKLYSAFFCSIILISMLAAQEHFSPVPNTGETNAVVIQSATINGSQLNIGDEIGVFDESLCVGAVIYNGLFPLSCTTILKYESPNGDVLPGARIGYQMSFKIWSKNDNKTGEATPDLEQGGNFGDILTVVKTLETSITNIDDDNIIPEEFTLRQNYPNPFNPVTNISFVLPVSGQAILEVYNVNGKKIQTLVDAVLKEGMHQMTWNGLNDKGSLVNSGTYLLRLKYGKSNKIIKMTLMK